MTHKTEHRHNPYSEHAHRPKLKETRSEIRTGVQKTKQKFGARSILFLPVGGMSNASTRLICYENAVHLRQRGWRVRVGTGDPSQYAITVFQKRYGGRDLERAKRAGGRTVLQISEARFMNGAKQKADVARFARQVDGVIVGTDVTRSWFKSQGIASTVIPTGLDFAGLPQGTKKDRPIKICWIGSGKNEIYLAYLVSPLNRLWQDYDFEFRVIGARMFNGAWARKPNFIRWQLGKAEEKVAECHIGVAPLSLGGIEMTKPPSKPVLYMALRLAVVATDTPPYRSLIQSGVNGFLIANNSPDGWYSALASLFDTEKRNRMAIAGNESCQPYNAPTIAEKWDSFLRRL